MNFSIGIKKAISNLNLEEFINFIFINSLINSIDIALFIIHAIKY
ncbi:hypothetical protein CPF_2669 [Clostridium perfringens ATCC 13124]|uniref:Uncharacterized protein n=1 Tax=Clostridium perfringens (strain ATCC 13124 / DSM 756 / JCM 1290 / NCIMB 6125 / NCTC 8237 / Type A) TaxID=195103 RepID=A0A0H2YT84_CLOP1|nr:hypothetical protein CPF_2669 [Clostridium perfringens ATCC 13124]